MMHVNHLRSVVILSLVLTVVYASSLVADPEILGASQLDKTGWAFTNGDVDGNGLDDLIIASSGSSPFGRQGAGTLTILWGGAPHGSQVDLSIVSSGFSTIAGVGSHSGFMMSVDCGDVNADGYDDVLLGLPADYPLSLGDGRLFIIFGGAVFPDTLDLESPATAVTSISAAPLSDGQLGFDIATGDINGDGIDDLIASAPYVYPAGEAYVFFGRTTWPSTIDMSDPGAVDVLVVGSNQLEITGERVASGDVDSDTFDDLLITSPGSSGPSKGGFAHIVYGAATLPDTVALGALMTPATLLLPEPDWLDSQHFGRSAAIGNVDGDAYSDIVVAAPGASPGGCLVCGAVYVIPGGVARPDTLRMDDTGYGITRMLGAGDRGGYGANAHIADLTGDGLSEVIVLKDNVDTPVPCNEVIVVEGATNLPSTFHLDTDSVLTRICQVEDLFGYGLGDSDVDSDGVNELVVGAHRGDPLGRNEAGMAFCYDMLTIASSITPPAAAIWLGQNSPNPFGGGTTIWFDSGTTQAAVVRVYDVRGSLVRTLTGSSIGPQRVIWDGRSENGGRLPSGTYFYRLETPRETVSRKLTILR